MAWKHNTVAGTDGKPRCGWASADPLYEKYHDSEWGRPLKDDQALFELLTLEGCQAGLSWITVLRKRENYRKAYDGFDPKRIAKYTPAATRNSTRLSARPGCATSSGYSWSARRRAARTRCRAATSTGGGSARGGSGGG